MGTKLKTILFSLVFFLGSTNSFGQSGSLDNTFDNDGKAVASIGIGEATATSVTVQPDGKIIVAGSGRIGLNYDFVLMRFNTNGSLDSTFGVDGKVSTDFSGNFGNADDFCSAVSLQSNGKIVVAGLCTDVSMLQYNVVVARYNVYGTLDSSFGINGKLITDINGYHDAAKAMVILADDKIMVAGNSNSSSGSSFLVMRYNKDGTLDNSFDFDGIVTTQIGNNSINANALAIQTDGKIVVAGNNSSEFLVARYNINGKLDSTFNLVGKVITPIGFSYAAVANSIAIQANGKILISGIKYDSITTAFTIVRYNVDGSIDNTFDNDGKVVTQIGSSYNYHSVIKQQSDGKILLAGSADNSSNNTAADFALARYNIDGSLDFSFDSDGIVITNFGNGDYVGDMLIQGNGKVIVVGETGASSFSYFAIARYNNDNGLMINEEVNEELFSVFPNPMKNVLSVRSNINSDVEKIRIFNCQGELLLSQTSNFNYINTENMMQGIYMLEISAKGNVHFKKLIKL